MQALLLCVLFFGLISMILPRDRRGSWMRLLLFLVIFLSFAASVKHEAWDFPELLPEDIEISSQDPQKIALHNAVSSRVILCTGTPPRLVESDLVYDENGYSLTFIHVILQDGDCEEVLHDLSVAFSFEGFVVTKE